MTPKQMQKSEKNLRFLTKACAYLQKKDQSKTYEGVVVTST